MPQMFLGLGIALGIGNTKTPVANAPVNVTPPIVTGTTNLGDTLTGQPGTWTGTPTPTYTYQWMRNDVEIAGATAMTHVIDALDLGTIIQIVETATNSAGSDFQYSLPVNVPLRRV